MLKILAVIGFGLSLSFSSSLYAREAVISAYEVSAVKSESQAGILSVHISGTALVASTGCEASRARARLILTQEEGQNVITAQVKPFLVARRVPCAPLAPGFKGLSFDASFDIAADQLSHTTLSNVSEEGHDILLSDVLVLDEGVTPTPVETGCESSRDRDVICTMEFNPTTCSYGSVQVSGGNACVARANLQRRVCASEAQFNPSLVSCTSGEAI